MRIEKLSLCITSYNRVEPLIQSFRNVHHDSLIDEIIIIDDCSTDEVQEQLHERLREFPKVTFITRSINVGMSKNKQGAIFNARNPWCIIFDSDNILQQDYLDKVRVLDAKPFRIYAPDAALPHFNYQAFADVEITQENAKDYLDKEMFGCLLNTCNYLVNREHYLATYEYNPFIKASDTAWFNYLWLKSGGAIQVVRGMTYFHRTHEGSGWLQDSDYNQKTFEIIKELIRNL